MSDLLLDNSVPGPRAPERNILVEGHACHISDNRPEHPVEVIQRLHMRHADALKQETLAQVYGLHMPLKARMEQTILTQFRRTSVLKSNLSGLESLMGTDETIDFADYLNDPEFERTRQVEVHTELDQSLKM